MLINKKINYSYKFPKSSDYSIRYLSPISMLGIILIMIIFTSTYKELSLIALIKVLLFSSVYLGLIVFNMIYKLDGLIKKIKIVCEENSNLSKNILDFRNHLLVCDADVKYNLHRLIVSPMLIILLLFYVLSKLLRIGGLPYFYVEWILMFSTINIFMFAYLRDIYKYFHGLKKSYYEIILQSKDFAESSFGKHQLIDGKKYSNKWRNLIILNLVLFLIIFVASFIFVDIRKVVHLTSLSISLIIAFFIMIDSNVIIKSYLTIMGEYDEYIKNKLGMEFIKSSSSPSTPMEFISENIKDLLGAIKDLRK
ncbi:hypothetical protein SMITH_620 [Smithella sp. ME-1]|uniref:Uncharacterized protein n=1 Tax=hydrocarbon metagenome TaxID=938273 RepID=A0A0W8FPV5_9ZZZZ|nr:hypothetical protein SMITH_620 [Smithella sp. ME-1]